VENGIALLCGAEIPGDLIFKPIAQLAGSGRPVYVVDGDNSFRSYFIARYAREMNLNPRRALAQVQVARAFTCYQLAAIVERLSRRADTLNCTGGNCAGIVCLGLLGTLYDEDVAWPEAQRLLREVITHLKVLAERWPVIVTVRPPSSKVRHRLGLIEVLMQQADVVRVLQLDPRYELHAQIPLRLSSGK
jgi:Rad51